MTKGLLRSLGTFALLATMEMAVAVSLAVSQTTHGTATEFDVASVRPSNPGIKTVSYARWTPDGFSAKNVGLQGVLIVAYDIHDPNLMQNLMGGAHFQGAPGWVQSDEYDIQAKISEADLAELSKLSPQQQMSQRREMLQALLSDRFNLKIHKQPVESRCFELAVAKNGPKNMKKEPDNATPELNWSGRTEVAAHAFPFDAFVETTLSAQVGCSVVDRTGLAGKYDFALKWTQDSASASGPDGGAPLSDISGSTISTALEEQLGLKLQPTKAIVETIVVDHVERPKEN